VGTTRERSTIEVRSADARTHTGGKRMKRQEDMTGWDVAGIFIVILVFGVTIALASQDSNTTITNSSTVNGYQNQNLANPDEYVRPQNRSVGTPNFIQCLFPTSAITPVACVTPIPAGTPGIALGCFFQNTNANPVICFGGAPLAGTPGSTTQCKNGIELAPGQSTYQVAPNGDCGQYEVTIPNVGTNSYQYNLVIER